jgi:tetratricopeptide (TPR) repeat protein
MSVHFDGPAVELFLDEAWAAWAEYRYRAAVVAAQRAVRVAQELDTPALLARALVAEADALRMLGADAAALARYTRVLALADDPATGAALGTPSAAWAVARAYTYWVSCARFLTGIGMRELVRVLDAAERWLAATGHRNWRAGTLLQRALVHRRVGDLDAAVAVAEEALTSYNDDAPGATLATLRSHLGDILREAGRHAEARPHYQAILDDPNSDDDDGRSAAYQGLARCDLADGDADAGRRHATAAVRLAEHLGDVALCTALAALTAACRAAGEPDAAWAAATRCLDAAGRIGGHYRPYFATRDAVDVALDRGDLTTATHVLADLDQHAATMDTATGTTTYTGETAQRRQRLTRLKAAIRRLVLPP